MNSTLHTGCLITAVLVIVLLIAIVGFELWFCTVFLGI